MVTPGDLPPALDSPPLKRRKSLVDTIDPRTQLPVGMGDPNQDRSRPNSPPAKAKKHSAPAGSTKSPARKQKKNKRNADKGHHSDPVESGKNKKKDAKDTDKKGAKDDAHKSRPLKKRRDSGTDYEDMDDDDYEGPTIHYPAGSSTGILPRSAKSPACQIQTENRRTGCHPTPATE